METTLPITELETDPTRENFSPLIRSLVEIFTENEFSSESLTRIFNLIFQSTRIDRISIDAFEPLSLPAIAISGDATEEASRPAFCLSFPLSINNQTIQFSVGKKSENLSGREKDAFEIIAHQLAFTYKTQLKIREERSERLISESLRRFSQELSSTLKLEPILSLILDHLYTLIPYDSANILLLEDGMMQMHANRGYPKLDGKREIPGICFIPENTTGTREVMATHDPLVLPDTSLVPDWLWLPIGEHVKTWLGVPLLVKGQMIGIIQIDKSTPHYFTQKHIDLAMALAVPAALAIDNARMLIQIQDAKDQLRGLSTQVMEAQEQERSKLAVELHDHAGQALLGLRAELQVLRRKISDENKEALEQIETLDKIMIELSQDLRRLAMDLHPPLLSELGLFAALEQFLEEFRRRLDIPITFEVHPANVERLPAAVELVCYRVIQEALTNMAKHALARSARIFFLVTEDHLNFYIQDDGVGLPRLSPRKFKSKGFGLVGMRERILSVGGDLQIWSQIGRGTRIEVDIPLKPVNQPAAE